VSGFLEWWTGLEAAAEEYILVFVESLWLYPALYTVSLIDGFFPVVPSESVVIASSSVWAASDLAWWQPGTPWILAIWLSAAAGAWTGDQVAYFIGTKVDVRNLRIFRNRRGVATLAWAEHALERRGTTFIVAARHIPMGRVAVNVTAGALRYPRRRFMAIDAVAVAIWAAWGVAIGTFAGALLGDNLLLSIAVGITGGILIGLAVDKIMSAVGVAPVNLPDLAHDIEERRP
jgi:membrane-associated protein